MKIAFFDSGVGGLTIFNKCVNQINAEYLYLADNKNTPYGIKNKELVKKLVVNNIEKVIKFNPDIIVIACNTATSVAINELRNKFKEKCIIGTEPAVKVAADENLDKRILVCATTLTTKEEKLNNLIKKLNIENITDFLPLDELVIFAENLEFNSLNLKTYLSDRFNCVDIINYSHVVLGCTHFPLFHNNIKDVLPESVKIIDSSDGVIKNIKNKIDDLNLKQNSNNNVTLLLTKEDEEFANKFKYITKLGDFNVIIV